MLAFLGGGLHGASQEWGSLPSPGERESPGAGRAQGVNLLSAKDVVEPGHINARELCNANTKHRLWFIEHLKGCCLSATFPRQLGTCTATPHGCVATVLQERWKILTDGLQDQRVRCHGLPVQTHDCPDHPIPEADAEFAILVPTCSKGQGPGHPLSGCREQSPRCKGCCSLGTGSARPWKSQALSLPS